MAGIFVDITPLRRYPKFRRVLAGTTVSATGTQLSVVAVAYEVYHLTRSDFDVGLVSLVQLVPSLLGSFIGGSVADAMDRRKLLVTTGVLMAIIAIGMAIDVDGSHPSLLVLYLLAACGAFLQALNAPAQTAVLLSIVDRDLMVKANALRQLTSQMSSVLGPTIAGVLIAGFGTNAAFWANAGSFLVSVIAVLGVGERLPAGGATRFGWHSITEGFAFLQSRQAIKGCLIADFNAMVLGMPTALFPAMAVTHFHGGPEAVGLLYAAPGIGAMFGAGLSGWTGRIRRPGRAICLFGVGWGVALIAFGLSPWLWAAVICLGLAGAADIIAAIFRGTIIQTNTPDRLRGRLTSIQALVVNNGPRLGNAEAGFVASATSTQFSVVSGGIGCVIGILVIAKLLPRFVNYEISDNDDEVIA